MFSIHEDDVAVLFHFIARNVANRIGIQDADFKATPELLEDIEKTNPKMFGHVDNFLKAYRAWFGFSKKIEKEGKSGRLSSSEQQELLQLEETRNDARKVLIEKVNVLNP